MHLNVVRMKLDFHDPPLVAAGGQKRSIWVARPVTAGDGWSEVKVVEPVEHEWANRMEEALEHLLGALRRGEHFPVNRQDVCCHISTSYQCTWATSPSVAASCSRVSRSSCVAKSVATSAASLPGAVRKTLPRRCTRCRVLLVDAAMIATRASGTFSPSSRARHVTSFANCPALNSSRLRRRKDAPRPEW